MNEKDRNTIKTTLIVALTLASLFVFYKSIDLFLAALIGIGFSVLTQPLVLWVSKKTSWKESSSAILIISLLSLSTFLLFLVFGAVIISQFDSLKEKLPEIIRRWEEYGRSTIVSNPKIRDYITSADSASGIANFLFGWVSAASQSVMTALTALGLAIIIGFFTMLNQKNYHESLLGLFPEKTRHTAKKNFAISAKALQQWFGAQFLDMCVVAALTSAGLWIVGIEFWAVYGILTGLLAIAPYVGIAFVFILSGSIVAVLQPDKFFWLLGVFAVTQFIEGNVIMPRLMRSHVNVPAVPLIFLMIMAGVWLGVLGVFVTPPALAIAMALSAQMKSKI